MADEGEVAAPVGPCELSEAVEHNQTVNINVWVADIVVVSVLIDVLFDGSVCVPMVIVC